MSRNPIEHFQRTKALAKCLNKEDIYNWLVIKGYFPEAYVLPPCFEVTQKPEFGTTYFEVESRVMGRFGRWWICIDRRQGFNGEMVEECSTWG